MARRFTSTTPSPPLHDESLQADQDRAAWLGERLRRLALGLTAALLAARAYWPSEPGPKDEAGTGLEWALAVLLTVGVGLLAALIGGRSRFRWSWTDAAVIALTVLIALSAGQSLERRTAINLAWEMGAVGLGYLLVRNLPRTRAESSALAGVLAATAAAVALYGLYQVVVELPMMHAAYRRDPAGVLRSVGIEPGSAAQTLYEMRLFYSNEPWSTFALANSLAGFLVGPLVLALGVAWETVRQRDGKRGATRLVPLGLASVPILWTLICLVLTKSRSAYIGLAVGLAVLAWRSRRLVRARTLGLVAALGVVLVSALVIGGLKTGRLDPLVVTEAGKSLQYRGEYWVGAWRVITENPSAFWFGRGPGNFGWAYLQHKLPEASEEIRDPHNMVLDVWATAGVWAALALVSALGLGLYNALGPASKRLPPAKPAESVSQAELDGPPERALWLVGWGGAGLVVVVLLGRLNLFDFELQVRWVILGFGWVMAAVLGQALWRRLPISAAALGAAALAVSVNLIAAGGIGFSAVAMPLWALVALGLNLRDDRPCHRPRVVDGRLGAFALAGIWAALVGSFAGAIGPFWTMEADLALADAALRARPPVFDPTLPIKERARRADAYYARARIAYDRATRADKYSARAWLGLAYLEGRIWKECGQEVKDERWKRIPILLFKAVDPPRNPNSWVLHRQRANVTRDLLAEVGPSLAPNELLRYRANIIEATRKASQLYPSNAGLHARLAEASAEIGMFGDAVLEANKALELDRAMPHLDKKLEGPLRARIQEHLPAWEKAANGG